jgi:hypothetical protein
MTTTTEIHFEWGQPDDRLYGREDSCWYTGGYGHDLVVHVRRADRLISVFVDGEMDIRVYERGDGATDFSDAGRIRYDDAFAEFGVEKDSDLWGLPFVEGESDLRGPNKLGYYFDFIHNSWYDLYSEQGEHLDCVTHSLTEAIECAIKILNDDDDELWEGESA